MRNIAIVIHKLYGGGAERAACNLSLALKKHANITLIAFDARKAAYPHAEPAIDLGVPAAKNLPERLMLLPKRVLRLRRIKKKNRFDCTIALLPGPSMCNALSRRKGEVTVMSVRNFLSMQENPSGLAALKTRLTARGSDCVVAVSRSAALDLSRNFRVPETKLRAIYNAVDASLLSREYDAHAPWMAGDGPLIVTMGRLHQQKGHWHLLRALRETLKHVPDARLVILGDGEYREKLIALARDLGIGESVFFPGYVVSPHGYVRRARLFVLSSLYEGMPNAMLEAMACGVPVVSADCPSGPREILAPDTSVTELAERLERAEYGMLTPPLDKGSFSARDPLTDAERCLSEAMTAMLTERETRDRYAKLALRRAADFSPDAIAEQWCSLIESLCGGERERK